MSYSGRRAIVINTQERALSVDINRLQSFVDQSLGDDELQLLGAVNGGVVAPGSHVMPTGSETPVKAEILGGLMALPTSGSLEVQVQPGSVKFAGPSPLPDDSQMRTVHDPGVGPGVLAFGANASGSIRIDVLEARINPVPAIVTDSRDVFDPGSGLFVAQSVTKEIKDRLEYRIRAGTPGSGYPGNVADYLPLLVASIPTATTTNDTIMFFDVRPLVEDRVSYALADSASLLPKVEEVDAVLATPLLRGYWSGVLKGRRVGGKILRTTPGTDSATAMDISEAANQSATYTPPITGQLYLYCVCPKGLPRWAVYAFAPASRLPRSPVGLLVVSSTAPNEFGQPTGAVTLPPSIGLGGTAAVDEAVCVMIVPADNAGDYASAYVTKKVMASFSNFGSITSAAFGAGAYAISVPSVSWPKNAKFMTVEIRGTVTVPTVSMASIETSVGGYGPHNAHTSSSELTNSSGGSEVVDFVRSYRLPRIFGQPTAAADPVPLVFNYIATNQFGSAVTPGGTVAMRIVGFET